MATSACKPPICQAYALAKAMKHRPTPQLASRYFETLKRMLGDEPAANHNTIGPATAEGTACSKRSIPQHC